MKPSIKSTLSVLILLLTGVCLNGQQKILEARHFESSDGFNLPYQISWGRLKSPEGTAPGREIPLIGVADISLRGLGSPEEGEQKTFGSPSFARRPLLLYLHGAGERGSDNMAQLNHGRDLFLDSEELEDVIVVAPQCPSDGYWVDIVRPTTREECAARTFPKDKDMTIPLKAVKELLDSLVDSGVVDTRRIYCTGLSMGGMGTLDLMMRYPDFFAAVQPICGAVNIDRIFAYKGNTAVRLFHGDCDETVPVHFSREAFEAFKAVGVETEYVEYQGVWHNSWDNAFAEKDFLSWLLKHSKAPHTGDMSVSLENGWRFRQANMHDWHPATVPGTVHTDLADNGMISDPYIGMNERDVQWIDKEDWVYETTFDVDDSLFFLNNIELCFDGLDTYADVELNGTKILSSDNMFRGWTVPVSGLLKRRDNRLSVYFHSPIRIGLEKYSELPYTYPACNDEPQSWHGGLFGKGVSVFTRKAGYHYGWDWGPRLVTSGIWRPVRLRGWDGVKINDVFYHQDSVSEREARLTVAVELTCDEELSGVTVAVHADGKSLAAVRADLVPGENILEIPVGMKNPELWWSNGLGKPFMYTFTLSVSDGGKKLASESTSIGLRSLRLVRDETPENGRTFRFELNGKPVFMKGANYIPCDVFLPDVTTEIYERTVADAAGANMNMLRVWGGGVYEDDRFYDLCDRNGILVWQDFMFACSLYPADDDFVRNVEGEAEYNIKRLRNHPCIALWCGNNECDEALYGWGWNRRYSGSHPEYDKLIESQQNHLYFNVLPDVVQRLAPGTAYVPSSPWSDKGRSAVPDRGDSHYWAVWNGGKSIGSFETYRSRFFSEYGFQSFPSVAVIRTFIPDSSDWRLNSDVFNWHQRSDNGTQWILKAMNEYFGQPEKFEDIVYMSQVTQAFAARTAVEAHRRDKGYCWGSLIWQHNDCWPVASWSGRDWYGGWKAQHYELRRAFSEVIVSPVIEGRNVSVSVISDRSTPVRGVLELILMDVNGNVLSRRADKIRLPANSNAVYAHTSLDCEADVRTSLVHARFIAGEEVLSECVRPFLSYKDMKLPPCSISASFKEADGGIEVTLSSDAYAAFVYLDSGDAGKNFSDNFFDLLLGQSRTVFLATEMSASDAKNRITISSLASTR